jgi:sec-independent protein translocase protein TatC
MIAPTPEEEAEIESSKAPLLEHLVELRKRLIYALLSFAIAFVICFAFSKEIYAFLTEPMARAMVGHPNKHLIYTAVYETFFTYMKVGLFAGLCLSFPLIAAQIWLFVAPGLYKHEKHAFLPFLAASPALFLVGAAFVYYVMLPFALKFFLGFETPGTANTPGIELQAKVSDYLDFVTTLIFAFGLTFQLPVLLTLLGKVGIVSSHLLRKVRRYAIVAVTALASFITPPDIFSMICLIVPLILLYEVSIWLVWLIEKKRDDERKAEENEV